MTAADGCARPSRPTQTRADQLTVDEVVVRAGVPVVVVDEPDEARSGPTTDDLGRADRAIGAAVVYGAALAGRRSGGDGVGRPLLSDNAVHLRVGILVEALTGGSSCIPTCRRLVTVAAAPAPGGAGHQDVDLAGRNRVGGGGRMAGLVRMSTAPERPGRTWPPAGWITPAPAPWWSRRRHDDDRPGYGDPPARLFDPSAGWVVLWWLVPRASCQPAGSCVSPLPAPGRVPHAGQVPGAGETTVGCVRLRSGPTLGRCGAVGSADDL